MPLQTCSSCKHWYRAGVNVKKEGVKAMGDCREHLHSLPMIRPGSDGQPECLGWFSGYPTTPADFPACGRFLVRLDCLIAGAN